MSIDRGHQTVAVDLPLSFVHALLTLRHMMNDELVGALERAKTPLMPPAAPRPVAFAKEQPKRAMPVSSGSAHKAMILGKVISGTSWHDLFSNCIEEMHVISPEALEILAGMKTNARRIIARERKDIHIRTPELWENTRLTSSGWWVDTNIGEPMFLPRLKKLAEAAQLEFGKDIIFPIPADHK